MESSEHGAEGNVSNRASRSGSGGSCSGSEYEDVSMTSGNVFFKGSAAALEESKLIYLPFLPCDRVIAESSQEHFRVRAVQPLASFRYDYFFSAR